MMYDLKLADLEAALDSSQFVAVRRRIFRQLIESLIYEGVVRPEMDTVGAELRFHLSGQDETGRPVLYLWQGQRRSSFARIRLSRNPVLRAVDGQASEADSIARFLWEIRALLGAPDERIVQFLTELEQTLLKDTLVHYQRRTAGPLLCSHSYDELESGLPDGHPYHPSYKSRLGFDYLDDAAFGPEYGPLLRPVWLAAWREWTQSAVSRSIAPQALIQQELGATTWTRFRQKIRRAGCHPDDYLLLPAHPWQWRERVVATLSADLRQKHLLLLGTAEDTYRPQQSIRTLANHSVPQKAYLKLSLSILNTSTSRILAPYTVCNAPLISDWLQQIAQEDAYLQEELRPVFLAEVLGIAYDRPQPDLLQPTTYGILSCIWRQSLHGFLSSDEGAVPWNTLCHLDGDGRPFITPWVHAYGLEHWIRHILRVSILPLIHLLYAYGIALEAHAQNMILIHQQGLPQRVAFKDFHDGIRFAPAHLTAPHKRPSLHAPPPCHAQVNRNSYLETEDPQEVRDFMHDAFFFMNLCELAFLFADHFGLEERHFWHLARTVITDYQHRFAHLRERFALFDLLAPTVQVEQLTKRRLYPDTEPYVHRVQNPLA